MTRKKLGKKGSFMIANIVILLLVLGYSGWVLRRMYKQKKAGICSCSGCSGCGCSAGCSSAAGSCGDVSDGGMKK